MRWGMTFVLRSGGELGISQVTAPGRTSQDRREGEMMLEEAGKVGQGWALQGWAEAFSFHLRSSGVPL